MQIRREVKTNKQKSQHSKSPLWWAKSKGIIFRSNISISLRKSYPKKKIKTTEKQTGSCSQSTTAELYHDEAPGCFVHNQISFFDSSRCSEEYFIWQDFVITKVPRRDCYKTVSSSIIMRNGRKGLVSSFPFLWPCPKELKEDILCSQQLYTDA